ncbi:3,9-dihydroxypterocarpan 6A-monooxygenase [Ricinus communis]|uniref:Cytochrome P450, putative n=1 Tax=Ricinus communis TaxID=3988 RepID=B9T2D2_RICCO|nr:3,9-dihydroxypterocarpan 6A-monooxygenase [Ricinus communis]EEF29986.1 cytochrome P450, putative [Ricinus communis]|eukprot:XP_002532401.1 3,9-dihydroxypterocarpan 6A-monooxygenase [Ricinus communis]
MAATSDDSISDCCLLFLLSLISIFVVRNLIRTYIKPSTAIRCPPSPPALPIIGHLHLVGAPFPLSFQTLARRYGNLMQLRLVSSTFVVASSAAIANEIFKTHDLNFASRFEMGPTEYNIYRGTGFIVSPYGAYWRFMRKLCMTELFGGSQFDRFNHIQEKEVRNLLKLLTKLAREGEPCDLNVELETLTNNLICKMALSKRFSNNDTEAKKMRKLVSDIMDTGAKLGVSEVFGLLKKIDLLGHGKKLEEALWRYDGVMEQIMKDYEENLVNGGENKEKDVMDILLQIYRNPNAEVKLTRIQIKHFILELFMASIDTESAAIQWTMAELINRPKVLNRLREEIDSVVSSSRLVKESDIPDLPYLQAIVKESLRLHPPSAMISRECTHDCKIDGFDIKAKTRMLINTYAIMRDPDMWPDPDEYMPERFLINATGKFDRHQMEMKRRECSYLPFGGGRRACIGFAHAYTLMHTTIAVLVQCFDWKVKDGEKIDINVSNGFSGTMAPPLLCYPITHFNPF